MRRTIVAGLMALSSSAASAEVLNVEFKFTPFVGDPAKEDVVKSVAGTAHLFLNGVPYADQDVSESELPVLFDEREIAASVWIPTESCGPALRKGMNTIRIDFEPADPSAHYRAQLRWASVMSESTEEGEPGRSTSTNQSGEGVSDKESVGPVSFEHEFQADFAKDLPWHHGPAVTSISDADKAALSALVAARAEAFSPDFSKLYALLEGYEKIDLQPLKDSKCLDKAYEAGARVAAPAAGEIDFVTTGNPEVVIRAKQGMLFFPADMAAFQRIEDEEVQMCIGMVFSAAYPPRLVVVRSASGAWEVAY